jgi:glycosyltransferase involved in cell wall biosynthesis
VEAYSRGTPIVASALGALEELIEPKRTGLHFRPGDADALARTMQWSFENPAGLSAMRENCRRTFETRYTAAGNVRSIEAIYRRALQHRHGTPIAAKL